MNESKYNLIIEIILYLPFIFIYYLLLLSWACMYSLPLLPSYLSLPPGSMSQFAETWVSLQTTTYKSKSTKYFDILLLLSCEEVLHAPTV